MYLDPGTIQFLRQILKEKKDSCEVELLHSRAADYNSYTKRFYRLELVRELEVEFNQRISKTEDYDEDDVE